MPERALIMLQYLQAVLNIIKEHLFGRVGHPLDLAHFGLNVLIRILFEKAGKLHVHIIL